MVSCPAMLGDRTCRRRVRKLYLAPGRKDFACRHCCDLCDRSQREDAWTRALSKAQAIRVRLGGSAAMHHPFPAEPKRMRWKTYRLYAGEVGRIVGGELECRPGRFCSRHVGAARIVASADSLRCKLLRAARITVVRTPRWPRKAARPGRSRRPSARWRRNGPPAITRREASAPPVARRVTASRSVTASRMGRNAARAARRLSQYAAFKVATDNGLVARNLEDGHQLQESTVGQHRRISGNGV